MRRRSGPEGTTELSCPRCGSQAIACERDAALLADVVALRDGVLLLAGPPVPRPFDDARLFCKECGTELEDVEWGEERPQHRPHGQRPLPDSEALDALAAKLNEPGECNGGDLVELVSTLLPRTGRRVDDEPDDEGVWS